MSDLDHYLNTRFLTAARCAQACAIAPDIFDALVRDRLVPAPSYVVTEDGVVTSHVFGPMCAPVATPGRFFPPSQVAWVAVAQRALAQYGAQDAPPLLRGRFIARFQTALAALNDSTWRLRDSFDDSGAPIAGGLALRAEQAWEHFLHGTFGLCVADASSEAAIARKEVLQEKLGALSENGAITNWTPGLATQLRALIDDYAAAAMPFSPVEFHRSSRKRLVDDLRARLSAA